MCFNPWCSILQGIEASLTDSDGQFRTELLARPADWWARLYAHLGAVMKPSDVNKILQANIFLVHAWPEETTTDTMNMEQTEESIGTTLSYFQHIATLGQ